MRNIAGGPGLTQKEIGIALENGIAISTVYRRIQKGWVKKDAIEVPPQGQSRKDRGWGRLRSFRLPMAVDVELDRQSKESGKPVYDFVCEIVTKHLKAEKFTSELLRYFG